MKCRIMERSVCVLSEFAFSTMWAQENDIMHQSEWNKDTFTALTEDILGQFWLDSLWHMNSECHKI